MPRSVKYCYVPKANICRSANYPVVLQNYNWKLPDHLMNIMRINATDYGGIETSMYDGLLPLVFITLVISEPIFFEDEFIAGFLNQEYPKEKLIICISTRSNNSGIFGHKSFIYLFDSISTITGALKEPKWEEQMPYWNTFFKEIKAPAN